LENLGQYDPILIDEVSRFGWRTVGAIALWVIGSVVINAIGKLTERGMTARRMDALIRCSYGALRVVLRIARVIAVLSVFGIKTTLSAAPIAAAGVAIGAAWSGLLASFASGIFLMILRPFKVGDPHEASRRLSPGCFRARARALLRTGHAWRCDTLRHRLRRAASDSG